MCSALRLSLLVERGRHRLTNIGACCVRLVRVFAPPGLRKPTRTAIPGRAARAHECSLHAPFIAATVTVIRAPVSRDHPAGSKAPANQPGSRRDESALLTARDLDEYRGRTEATRSCGWKQGSCDYHPNGRVNLPVRLRTMSNDRLQVIVGTPMSRITGSVPPSGYLVQTKWRDVDGHRK
jgi:hypothetical protein